MSILFFQKNRLVKFSSSGSFFYKYINVQSLQKGQQTQLYLSRIIFQFYRYLPALFNLAAVSFRFFTLFYRSCHSLIHLRFWLLTLHHFLAIYKCIFFLRILTEYFFINQHQSNKLIKIIFELTEPYFQIAQSFLPQGIIGSLLAFQIIDSLNGGLEHFVRILSSYDNNSKGLREVYLLLSPALGETIAFS